MKLLPLSLLVLAIAGGIAPAAVAGQRVMVVEGQKARPDPKVPLEHYVTRSSTRDEAIANAYKSGAYGLKEIGDHFGLHYSRVSRIIANQRKKIES